MSFLSVVEETYFSGMNRVEDALLGGWELSGIFSYASGAPLSFDVPGATLGNSYDTRPNLVGSLHVSNPGPTGWFNPSALVDRLPTPMETLEWVSLMARRQGLRHCLAQELSLHRASFSSVSMGSLQYAELCKLWRSEYLDWSVDDRTDIQRRRSTRNSVRTEADLLMKSSTYGKGRQANLGGPYFLTRIRCGHPRNDVERRSFLTVGSRTHHDHNPGAMRIQIEWLCRMI